jgi:hypothetical protein
VTDTRRTVEILAVALAITLVAVWAIGRASRGDTEARVRAEMRDSVAHEVALAIAPLRREKERADSARLSAEAKLAKVRQSAGVTLGVTGRTVDSLRTVPVTDTTALPTALAAYDSLAGVFRAYLHADSTAHALTDSARVADHALMAAQDRALAAMTQARDAWRQAATCRTVFRIRCPTRTQAFVSGAVLALTAVVVLR